MQTSPVNAKTYKHGSWLKHDQEHASLLKHTKEITFLFVQ